MRLPNVRIRVRTLMIAVAVAAVAIWRGQMIWRSQTYRDIAASHAISKAFWKSGLAAYPEKPGILPEVISYHARLQAKYRRAARYPWVAIEPDPPKPTILNPPDPE